MTGGDMVSEGGDVDIVQIEQEDVIPILGSSTVE